MTSILLLTSNLRFSLSLLAYLFLARTFAALKSRYPLWPPSWSSYSHFSFLSVTHFHSHARQAYDPKTLCYYITSSSLSLVSRFKAVVLSRT